MSTNQKAWDLTRHPGGWRRPLSADQDPKSAAGVCPEDENYSWASSDLPLLTLPIQNKEKQTKQKKVCDGNHAQLRPLWQTRDAEGEERSSVLTRQPRRTSRTPR